MPVRTPAAGLTLLAVLAVLAASPAARAQQTDAAPTADRPATERDAPRGTFNLVLENDRIANTDRHYTHGTYLSYVTGDGAVPGWIARAGTGLPGLAGDIDRVGFALGQTIFTPDNIAARRPIRDDRPYAGYLYGGLRLYSEQLRPHGVDGLQVWELNLGLIGPQSKADEVQNGVHDLIDVQRANGWDNQLHHEPAVNLYYERKWRFSNTLDHAGHQLAAIPHVTAALGNIYTYAGGGVTVAVGRNLQATWGPARILPAGRGADFFDARRGGDNWYWMLFAGGEARAVARNLFLDGNSFQDSLSVNRKPAVGELQFGLEIGWDRYRLALTQVFRSKSFEGQDSPDAFGSVTLSVQF
jgi:hypothetical protein